MTIITLMLGILIGAPVFLGAFFSGVQAIKHGGKLRVAHGAVVLTTLAGMLVLQVLAAGLALPVGLSALAAGLAAAVLETGWNRVMPLFPAAFGLALVLGLPFAGV